MISIATDGLYRWSLITDGLFPTNNGQVPDIVEPEVVIGGLMPTAPIVGAVRCPSPPSPSIAARTEATMLCSATQAQTIEASTVSQSVHPRARTNTPTAQSAVVPLCPESSAQDIGPQTQPADTTNSIKAQPLRGNTISKDICPPVPTVK